MTNGNGTQREFEFALIGCGRISQVHLQTISKEPRAKLVAVADIDEQAARGVGEAFGVPWYGSHEELLKAKIPDAVIVCTPPSTHRHITESCLEAGCHVLCEKPLSISVEDAEAMLSKAEETEKVLMMASKFRYVQDIVRAKAIIESGILGEIVLYENEFCARVDMKKRWNADPLVAGGGVLIDNGSHSVDIVRYLLGPIRELQTIYGKRWQEIEVEDTCRVFVRCEDGTMASIDLSWSIHKENPYFIHVYGTAGTLEIGWKGSRYRQSEKLEWVNFGTGYDKFQAVGAQLSNLVDIIAGTGVPVITPADALESVRVIQRAYATANDERWEKVSS